MLSTTDFVRRDADGNALLDTRAAGSKPGPSDVLWSSPFAPQSLENVGGILGGTAGTATMTLAYETERRLRNNHQGSFDYDDSLVPGKIIASIMHWAR